MVLPFPSAKLLLIVARSIGVSPDLAMGCYRSYPEQFSPTAPIPRSRFGCTFLLMMWLWFSIRGIWLGKETAPDRTSAGEQEQGEQGPPILQWLPAQPARTPLLLSLCVDALRSVGPKNARGPRPQSPSARHPVSRPGGPRRACAPLRL